MKINKKKQLNNKNLLHAKSKASKETTETAIGVIAGGIGAVLLGIGTKNLAKAVAGNNNTSVITNNTSIMPVPTVGATPTLNATPIASINSSFNVQDLNLTANTSQFVNSLPIENLPQFLTSDTLFFCTLIGFGVAGACYLAYLSMLALQIKKLSNKRKVMEEDELKK